MQKFKYQYLLTSFAAYTRGIIPLTAIPIVKTVKRDLQRPNHMSKRPEG